MSKMLGKYVERIPKRDECPQTVVTWLHGVTCGANRFSILAGIIYIPAADWVMRSVV